MKRAKQNGESKASSGSGSAEAQPSSAPAAAGSGKPDLAALAKGLPAGWQPMWDKASGEVYYGKLSTGVSLARASDVHAWTQAAEECLCAPAPVCCPAQL